MSAILFATRLVNEILYHLNTLFSDMNTKYLIR